MIGGLKRIKVQPGKEAEFEKVFKELRMQIRKHEAGNLYYDLYSSQAESGNYIVMERYIDQQALDAHKNSAHGAAYFPKIRTLLEKLAVEYFNNVD